MAPRVDSELLLVGSLPADSTDSALRSAAGFFGDLVFALPDGETGCCWCGFGRQPGADGTETMREHARVIRTVQGAEHP